MAPPVLLFLPVASLKQHKNFLKRVSTQLLSVNPSKRYYNCHGCIAVTCIICSHLQAAAKAVEILETMAIPLKLDDRQSLLMNATTSLGSKVVSQHSSLLAPLAVDAVLKVIDPARDHDVDLRVSLSLYS